MANPKKLRSMSFNAAGIPGQQHSRLDIVFFDVARSRWRSDRWVDFCLADPPSSLNAVVGCEPSSLSTCFFRCIILAEHSEDMQHQLMNSSSLSPNAQVKCIQFTLVRSVFPRFSPHVGSPNVRHCICRQIFATCKVR